METKNKKILYSLYFIFFMIGSTTTAIDPIIPKISEDLKIGFDKIGYIFLIGSFFSLIFTLVSGRLSDKFNVNNIILTGI
ncbi:MAG: MFS transporter, partial [Actinobacteria bacterium]|nr:MFS transporter [Actinomycetota bacterium]